MQEKRLEELKVVQQRVEDEKKAARVEELKIIEEKEAARKAAEVITAKII